MAASPKKGTTSKKRDDQVMVSQHAGVAGTGNDQNEHAPNDDSQDYRHPLRQIMFRETSWKKVTPHAMEEEAFIKVARKEIQLYQKKHQVDLLKRLKSFVLPGVRPTQHG